MSIEIHVLDSDNAEAIRSVGDDVFDHPIDDEQLQAFIDDPRHILCFATHQGTVVGMASAVEYFHPDKKPQLWINEAGVADSFRNQGIGRRLLQELMEIGKSRGCVAAWLGTEHDNEAAKACYRAIPGGETAESFLMYEWDFKE